MDPNPSSIFHLLFFLFSHSYKPSIYHLCIPYCALASYHPLLTTLCFKFLSQLLSTWVLRGFNQIWGRLRQDSICTCPVVYRYKLNLHTQACLQIRIIWSAQIRKTPPFHLHRKWWQVRGLTSRHEGKWTWCQMVSTSSTILSLRLVKTIKTQVEIPFFFWRQRKERDQNKNQKTETMYIERCWQIQIHK